MVLPMGAEPPMPTNSISLHGTSDESIERFKIREIMEGFPCHRDACEWTKMRALFADKEAFVFTTWSGGVPIDEFIDISKEGFANGVKIAHRVNGATIDIATSGPAADKRALGKLKATITQRFLWPAQGGGESVVDVDADCRLCFFLEKKDNMEWKTHFFKGFYEKDRIIPVNPTKLPIIDENALSEYPDGYKHLGYAQSAKYKIKMDLPQSVGEEHDHFYKCFIDWLNGDSVDSLKVSLGV